MRNDPASLPSLVALVDQVFLNDQGLRRAPVRLQQRLACTGLSAGIPAGNSLGDA